MGILDLGVRAEYSKGAGATPRCRGLPRNHTRKSNSVLISEKLWMGSRDRRAIARSARDISLGTPIGETPTTSVRKKNPDRTISTGRRAIADMRRIYLGINPAQYYPMRFTIVESLARLLVSMAVSFHGIPVQLTKRDIASAFRLLRIRPSLSLVMCDELHGGILGLNSIYPSLPRDAFRSECAPGELPHLRRRHAGNSPP